MQSLFAASASTSNADTIACKDTIVNTLYIEVYDAGSWSGSVKFAARLRGSSAVFTHFLALTDLGLAENIAGATGITAAGLYAVDISGFEVQAQHTRSAGAVTVNATLMRG